MTLEQGAAEGDDWIKLDLHIHTLDDPKDKLDYTAHQLLERAHTLGFHVLAITLHDAVFDRAEVFSDAREMGILLIPAAEVRLQGADVVLLNVNVDEVARLQNFDDLRKLRAERGSSLFTFAPHPFYVLGGSIGSRLFDEIDCFDGIEWCHFYKGWFNPNRRARRIATEHGKRLIAASDAHKLNAFGSHYTSVPRPAELNVESVLRALRCGPIRLTSPPSTLKDIVSTFYFVFVKHPLKRHPASSMRLPAQRACARQS